MALGCSSSSSICGSSPIMNAIPAVFKPGNEPSRLGGSQKKLCGLETRTVSNCSRKRACAIRAAKSGPVETSADTSRGSAEVQSHLTLLERMTKNSTGSSDGDGTIRDQLEGQMDPEASEVVVPLANNGLEEPSTPVPELTISQKRNIRRQNYLKKSSERNDAPFFAAVVGLVLVPPILILGFAVATGFVEFFP